MGGGLADELHEILADESAEQAKERLRLLITRSASSAATASFPAALIPTVRAMPREMELAGLEPATSWVRSRIAGFRSDL
jgi:hypothetical protein